MTTITRSLTPEQSAAWLAQEHEHPKGIHTQVLVESSLRLEMTDPGGKLRAAVGTAIDTIWLGDMLELATFGDGTIVRRRVAFNSLLGGAISGALASSDADDSISLGHTLGEMSPHYEGHGELMLLLAAPQLTIPVKASYLMLNSPFIIGSIGGEPGQGLHRLAGISGGFVLPIRNAREATDFGERFVERYRIERKRKNHSTYSLLADELGDEWGGDEL